MTSEPTAEQLAELVALAEAAARWPEYWDFPAGGSPVDLYLHAANPAVIGPLARDVSQLRDRVAELTEALRGLLDFADGQQGLLAAYRAGRSPSEATWRKLDRSHGADDRARALLAALPEIPS